MFRKFTSAIAVSAVAAIVFSFATVSDASAAGRGNDRCVHNYYSSHPCLPSIKKWRSWAEYHGLEANRQSAAAFQAYAEYDTARGDRLFAALKGIDVEQAKGTGLQVQLLVDQFAHMPAEITPEQEAAVRAVRSWY
ncbi:MAG: hypothetical protein R3245_12915 [Kiloniellales bacterium]|nr:hypothetical protein [Kiloniellales bacterium]